MTLDVGIQVASLPKYPLKECVLSFDNDGYYWFLHPLFEDLANRTGKYIDLYGAACFQVDELFHIEKLLEDARGLVQSQSIEWEVHCETQVHPVHKDILKSVTREGFEEIFVKIEQLIKSAKETRSNIFFFGD